MEAPPTKTTRQDIRAAHRLMAQSLGTVGGKSTNGEPPVLPERFRVATMLTRLVMAYERCRSQSRRLHPLLPHERRAIGVLWESGAMTVSELARAIPLSTPATSEMIERLVLRSFVERSDDPTDRRRTLIRATAHVVHSIDAASFEGTARYVESLDEFSDEEYAVVLRALDLLYDAQSGFADELEALTDEELVLHVKQWEAAMNELDSTIDTVSAPPSPD